MAWCGVVWYGIVWYGVVWCGMAGLVVLGAGLGSAEYQVGVYAHDIRRCTYRYTHIGRDVNGVYT